MCFPCRFNATNWHEKLAKTWLTFWSFGPPDIEWCRVICGEFIISSTRQGNGIVCVSQTNYWPRLNRNSALLLYTAASERYRYAQPGPSATRRRHVYVDRSTLSARHCEWRRCRRINSRIPPPGPLAGQRRRRWRPVYFRGNPGERSGGR